MALYHIAKGPVNYTVVGNPTIVDGVVSGFSDNDYLLITYVPSTTKEYKLVTEFTTGTSFPGFKATIIGTVYGFYSAFGFLVQNDGLLKFNAYLTNADDTSQSSYFETSTGVTLTPNQKYYAELVISNSSHTITSRISTDKQNWTVTNVSIPYNNFGILASDTRIGIGKGQEGYFTGSVDLNNTYIMINGQPWFGNCPVEVKRHQIMGPVGYTVVGSPTIVDGVLSNCDMSNYVTPGTLSNLANKSWEIVIRFYFENNLSEGNYALVSLAWYYAVTGLLTYSHEGNISLFANMGNSSSNTGGGEKIGLYDTNISSPGYYDVKLQYNNSTGQYTLGAYTTAGVLLQEETYTPNTPNKQLYGINEQSGDDIGIGKKLDGIPYGSRQIDLNHTYIKVNNELWFYQPQETKYIIREDKLVWADPRIYLRGDGNSVISLNSVFRTDHTYTIHFRLDETTPLADGAMFGSREGYANSSVIWCNNFQGYPVLVLMAYGGNNISIDYSKHILQMNTIAKLDNVQVDNAVNVSYNLPVGLFGFKQDGVLESRMFNGDIYSYTEIDENGNIIYELVPVPAGLVIGNFTVPSNGMFDIVNQKFYANQGTGEFTIGRDE